MAKNRKTPTVTTRRNKPRGTSKSEINPKSPTSTTIKNNSRNMTTPKKSNTTTLVPPIDQISTLKTSEKPPEQPTTFRAKNMNTPVPDRKNDQFTTVKSAVPPTKKSLDLRKIIDTTAVLTSQIDLNSAKPLDSAPEPTTNYKKALTATIDTPMTDPSNRSTFIIQKEICDHNSDVATGIDDDSTVELDNQQPTTDFVNSVRMTMMFKLPGKKEGCSDEEAPTIAIQRMNEMLKALTNKLPCRVGPWNMTNIAHTTPTSADLLTSLPDDVDFVESYVFDYNRFIGSGKTGYVRLHIYYSDMTSVSEIKSVVVQFKKARERFFEVSHSNATSPVHIGTLTGSVQSMANSKDFSEVMKNKFNLSELGLWFSQARSAQSEFDRSRFTLHLEIDRNDLPKRAQMEQYFNHSVRSLDTTFFGTPMLLTKPFDYFAEDDEKEKSENHARKQSSLGKSIRSTTISGVQLNNWTSSAKDHTLLRELMAVESIVDKKIVKGKKSSTFRGRLFYAIIPDKASKTITFHYSRANSREGRSVARGLPLFIRDHFKLDPAFFCSSASLTEALDGEWSLSSRTFLSAEEKIEFDKLELMEDEINAEPEIFISKDHQRALALDDDDFSAETRLTKGDAAPPPATADDLSDMTGSTRESKAKAYADSAVKVVAAQYSETISNMNSDIGAKDDRIAQLELALRRLEEPPDPHSTTEIQYSLPPTSTLGEEDLTLDGAGSDTSPTDHNEMEVSEGDHNSTTTHSDHSPSTSNAKRLRRSSSPSENISTLTTSALPSFTPPFTTTRSSLARARAQAHAQLPASLSPPPSTTSSLDRDDMSL